MNNNVLRCFMMLVVVLPAAAQERPSTPEERPPVPPDEFLRLDREVSRLTRQLGDWEEQYDLIEVMIRNVWHDNGWDSESDLFARDAALEISRVPPWRFNERMRRMREVIDRRYQLTDGQREQLQGMFYRETFRLTVKYGPAVLGNVRELIETRLQNKPLTAGQVASMEKAMDPLVGEWQKDFERLSSEFGQLLGEEQKRIFERDLQSAHKRLDHYMRVREDWKNGGWTASEWGMQDDPVQMGRLQPARGPTDAVADGASLPWDESTWETWVRAFINYYQLDSPQQTKCMVILDGLVEEARYYRKRHDEELAAVPQSRRMTSIEHEPIRLLYLQLKSRLNSIPTESQIRAAAERNPDPLRRPEPRGDTRTAPAPPRGGGRNHPS